MDPRNPSTRWIEQFFDVSEPYLYVLILPPLVLFALGHRRFSLIYFLGAAALMAILNVT